MKYFIKFETEWSGTDGYELIEAKDLQDAERQAEELARDNYEGYSNIWEEQKEEEEKEGGEWIDSEHYSWEVEEYNPEKHDDFLN